VKHLDFSDTVKLAQASVITAQVDECRRIALEQQTNSVAEDDADFLKEKTIYEGQKTETLLATAKKPHPAFGTFGDVRAFDNYSRSPAKIAQSMSIDAKATLQAVSSALTALEGRQMILFFIA
jgi:hypothetical protein